MAETTASPGAQITPTSSSRPELDETFYTWSNFFSILTGTATTKQRDAYFTHKDTLHSETDVRRAEADKDWLFKYSPTIRFLQHNIDLLSSNPSSNDPSEESATATITPTNVRCKTCPTKQSGGFSPDHGILLCANHLRTRSTLEDTLAHEMIHAYDHLRFKLDPFDLRHAACMEIRASTLSGECRWTREFFGRGQWGLTMQLQECVRRRAVLSVMGRPACEGDRGKAERVVDEVWRSCFSDTRPFDEIYR
ncbi:Mitochondrial inner membrane protease atp23 [Recurvomyces mirabilis]|uniref:Mitochondrial inner membrane protease ATP23 n=1 Tax=Recurvomyces mirabilis TaxID=574656 RepID=A0AAE0WH48_9PEZI|nr:Mitochondrial inner membrane protease atp23 [Recurvomyces mirabilis]KAK5150759.1 Mitochondrial inner membrane protease atp23 [Recurvomyces mirabilis]